MKSLIALAVLVSVAAICPASMIGQQPTTGQVQQALQNPDIVAQLRARMKASGLTNDQIRQRLKEMGYPENLLDAYMTDSTATTAPTGDAAAALMRLGMLDSTAQQQQKPAEPPAPVQPHSDIFGLDIFRTSTSRFDPLTAGPVDANYKVGPRDVLALILTGGVEASYALEVSAEGFVVIPQVGEVYVANLTLDQIRDVFFTRLGRVYSGVTRSPNASTKFSVSVARVRANQVFVIGEAVVPGSYQVSSAGTMLTALYAAGGPSDNGSMRDVELRRGGKILDTLDLYDYLVRGDASRDQRLESGDVLFLPFHGKRVTIRGEVGRPMIFELKPGETLRDLLVYAGGFTPTAARHRIEIRRILSPSERTNPGVERVVLDISANQLVNGQVPPFPLEPGDQIQVFGVSDVERNVITVTGHVWAPGDLGLSPGMRLSDALRAVGGVRPGVFTDQVLVTRREPGSTVPVQLRTSFVDTTGRLSNDLPLEEGDSVRVFSRAEFAEDRTVSISGAVHKPGAVSYREGMTLRDAVLLAGGLDQSAYLPAAEIARVTQSTGAGITARTFRVPLDSTYLFERGPDGKYLGPPGVQVPTARVPEVVLEPYDQVLILRQPDWKLVRRVQITGEVQFPGTYTLTSRSERLTDLVRHAGGVTAQGYAEGTAFIRSVDSTGRIDVSLARALKNENSLDNIVLLDGDSIHVPLYSPVVRVAGAVSSPSSIAYVPGEDLNYYVDAAGGALPTGNRNRAYVVQPNGSRELYRHRFALIPDGVPRPQAGSEIFVPLKAEEKTSLEDRLVPFAQALTALATFVYVISR